MIHISPNTCRSDASKQSPNWQIALRPGVTDPDHLPICLMQLYIGEYRLLHPAPVAREYLKQNIIGVSTSVFLSTDLSTLLRRSGCPN